MKPISYWLDTAPDFAGAAAGPVEGRFDVAVIGAGFTGLSAALALSRAGASVAVLEAGRVGGEASGRNGGQCNAGTAHDFSALAATHGEDAARAYYLAHSDAVETVGRLAAEESIDCGFRRSGRLKLAAKPQHFPKLVKAYETLIAKVDPNVELIPPEAMRQEIGSDQFHGGLLQKTSAQLHVGRFAVGLAEAAARRGARVWEQAAVTDMAAGEGGYRRLITPKGAVEAKQVLLATGGAGPGPFPWHRRRIVPVGSFIIVTEPLADDVLRRLLPTGRNYVTSRQVGNYFRTLPDNRLLFGGRARFAMSNPKSDRKSGVVLRRALARTFPELARVGIDYCWGGQVDMTADRLPRAGEHAGLFYAMGFSGHGVQMATHTGQAMAEVMQGRPQANPWRDLPWPAIPAYAGKPWFLPVIGAWHRFQDLIH